MPPCSSPSAWRSRPRAFSAESAKPVPAAELARSVNIPYEAFTLDNGLRVVVHTDRKAPVVAVQAWYNVGSKDEPDGKTGYAHLFEHIGLFNPTENLPGGLMEPLRAIGATDWNGTTWFDRTNFFQTVPTSALEQALYMESDRMGHLLGALNQERLDNQRGVVQNEKRQGDNQPYGLVEYAQLEALFPKGHPYHHSTIGSMADLDAASLEDLRQWHRDNYGPNNAVLVLAGDIDVADREDAGAEVLRRHPARRGERAGAGRHPDAARAHRQDAARPRVEHAPVSHLDRARACSTTSAADLDVAATVLGGLASSRLDNALVRGDETAVAVTASYQPFHRLGMFEVERGREAGTGRGRGVAQARRADRRLHRARPDRGRSRARHRHAHGRAASARWSRSAASPASRWCWPRARCTPTIPASTSANSPTTAR